MKDHEWYTVRYGWIIDGLSIPAVVISTPLWRDENSVAETTVPCAEVPNVLCPGTSDALVAASRYTQSVVMVCLRRSCRIRRYSALTPY